MKTNKRGISLIVLVITIIVLAILATTVIISLSNTNIIEEASNTVNETNLKTYEEQLAVAYSSWSVSKENRGKSFKEENIAELAEHGFESSDLPATHLVKVVNGAPTIVEKPKTVSPESLKIGDTVAYTPAPVLDANGQLEGPAYVDVTPEGGYVYNLYEQTTANYAPGNMEWVYFGQDSSGNYLLTSKIATDFTMMIGGGIGYTNGPQDLDTLCSLLYGNSEYGTARNMKYEDINGKDTTEYSIVYKQSKDGPNQTAFWLSSAHFIEGLGQDFYYLRVVSNSSIVNSQALEATSNGDASSIQMRADDAKALRPVIVLDESIQFGEPNASGAWTLIK